MQHIGVIREVCLPGVEGTCYVFLCLREQKKSLGCGLVGGINTQADTMTVQRSLLHIWKSYVQQFESGKKMQLLTKNIEGASQTIMADDFH